MFETIKGALESYGRGMWLVMVGWREVMLVFTMDRGELSGCCS